MKLKATMNDVNIGGTSLKGYIATTRAELDRVFGKGIEEDTGKTRYEWWLLFEDEDEDVIATIYDWKNYDWEDDGNIAYLRPNEVFRFNIGGSSHRAVEAIKEAMDARQGLYAYVE